MADDSEWTDGTAKESASERAEDAADSCSSCSIDAISGPLRLLLRGICRPELDRHPP